MQLFLPQNTLRNEVERNFTRQSIIFSETLHGIKTFTEIHCDLDIAGFAQHRFAQPYIYLNRPEAAFVK